VGSPLPNKDSVRSEELASPVGVIFLSNIVLPTSEKAEKEEKEAMNIPISKRFR